jgi:hypothetical protein
MAPAQYDNTMKLQPATERRRARCLRIVGWIALIGGALLLAGSAAFVGGIYLEFRQHAEQTPATLYQSPAPFLLGFAINAVGLLAALVGLGMLLGSLICWCVAARPQFRLRTCFVACLVLAIMLACGPFAVRLANEAGISASRDGVTIQQSYENNPSSFSSVQIHLPLNPMLLVPVLLPTLLVTFVASRMYP